MSIKAKWTSPRPIPAVGDRVLIGMNRVGPGVVVDHTIYEGYQGVVVKPDSPPRWYVNQNGKDASCLTFGAELADFGPHYGHVIPDDLALVALIRECEEAIPQYAAFLDRNAMVDFMWTQAAWTQGLTLDLVVLVISMVRVGEMVH